ncbi:MAG TPA: SDR family oxidoreductase [Longimicrobiales bacterium]
MSANGGREVVVITGASAGIGRAAVREFARHGADIGLLARGRAGLEAARREVEAAGGRALAIPTDVAESDQVEAAAEAVERELGPIDVWVNNAMASVFSPFKEMTMEEFRRVTEVTYLGYVQGTMSALRRMLPRDRGTIVQVGSALAYRGIPLQSAYCGAKHAIQGFTESVRSELMHDGSRVWITMVQMPAVNTPQFSWVKSRLPRKAQPVPPIYEPEVAARAILWAAHHRRREVEVGMSTVIAIWGDKLAAGIGDRYLAHTGYRSQQHDGPEDPNRPHNLWEPVDDTRDFGAHGKFDARARASSPQLWINTHLGLFLAGAVGALGAGLVAWTRRDAAGAPTAGAGRRRGRRKRERT